MSMIFFEGFFAEFLFWGIMTFFNFGIIQAILTFFNNDREHNSKINFIVCMLVSLLGLLPSGLYVDIFIAIMSFLIVYFGLEISHKYKNGIK